MPAVYLDNAATSFPKPPRVYERIRGFLEEYGACPGRGSHEMARQAEAVIEATRRVVAELFGASDPRRIVFALNATDALNMAIKGVLQPGDHVVTTVMEHNSVNRPLNALERDGLIRVIRVPTSREGLVDPQDVRRAVTDRTRLVVMLHASNVTGTLQPIAAIGRIVREAGRLLLVDAAQTAGAYPIDVEPAGIDLLAFPGHKALMGPPGTGGLYVGPRAAVRPWREGGTGVMSEAPLQPEELPLRLEAGSPNTLGIALLGEAVRFILQFGVEWIRAREMALTDQLLVSLQADGRFLLYGPAVLSRRVAVVSLNIPGVAPDEIGEMLSQTFHVAVRTGLHCAPGAHRAIGTFPTGTVRLSPGYFTAEAEIAQALDALRHVAGRVRRPSTPAAAGRRPVSAAARR
ncbi:MAG: aminotransferase class V-fold PLP-dependent enzyme [Candidatus Omnitrophica bacterium]|nr:aminotransferase class V-fold PLP-dependent enzyme [Candidatus Omnitrophota bacterium]